MQRKINRPRPSYKQYQHDMEYAQQRHRHLASQQARAARRKTHQPRSTKIIRRGASATTDDLQPYHSPSLEQHHSTPPPPSTRSSNITPPLTINVPPPPAMYTTIRLPTHPPAHFQNIPSSSTVSSAESKRDDEDEDNQPAIVYVNPALLSRHTSPTDENKPSRRHRGDVDDNDDETGSHHSSSHGRMVCISRSGDKRTYIVDEYPNILHARGRSETEFTVVSMNSLTEGDLEDVIAGVSRDRLDIRGYGRGGSMLSSAMSYDPYAADADLSSIGTVSMTRLTSLSPSDAGESTVTATTITTIDDPDTLRRLSSVDHLYHIFRQMEKAEWVPLMSDGESMHSLYTDPSGRWWTEKNGKHFSRRKNMGIGSVSTTGTGGGMSRIPSRLGVIESEYEGDSWDDDTEDGDGIGSLASLDSPTRLGLLHLDSSSPPVLSPAVMRDGSHGHGGRQQMWGPPSRSEVGLDRP